MGGAEQRHHLKASFALHPCPHPSQVLTAPTQVLSAIQVEAYKKYLLLCLLVHGEPVALPSASTSSLVLRHVERMCQPYVELGKA